MEKKLLLGVVVVVCLCGSAALALDPMGPPAAGLDKGNWSLGAEYSYSEMEIERQLHDWSSAKSTVEIEMHKIYANIGYGIADNVDGFVRLGAASLDFDEIPGRNYDYKGDGDWDFVWGGGLKVTLVDSGDVKWGLLAQYSWADLGGTQKGNGYTADYDIKLDELQIAAGPTWTPSDGIAIYGGPFLHFVRGRWKEEVPQQGNWETRKPVEEESWFGGYIGTEIELAQNTNVTVEGQFTGDAWAVACGILFKR